MSLFDYLEKVRQKPEPERRRLLMVWTVSVTLFIILLWLGNIFLFMPRADSVAIVGQQERFSELADDLNEAFRRIYLGFDLVVGKSKGLFR